jgi:hypothetical protein
LTKGIQMGLDQYMYAASKTNSDNKIKLGYRRKHPNLHGWMEKLWLSKLEIPLSEADQFIQDKQPPREFNGVELELTWDDITALEGALLNSKLPHTTGFFFGDPSDDYYKEDDLEFIREAKQHLFLGLKVFYNSSW